MIQYTTRDGFPPFSLVDEINKIFLDLKGRCILFLKHNKDSALKDFICTYLSMVDKTASTSSVAKGFVSNRMLDKQQFIWPDFDTILQTMHFYKESDLIVTLTMPGTVLIVYLMMYCTCNQCAYFVNNNNV